MADAKPEGTGHADELRELRRRLEELEKIRAHRDWRVSELEKHASNLEVLNAEARKRVEELERHAANLGSIREQLETHVRNLEELLLQRDSRVQEVEAHARNLDGLLRERESRVQALESHARNLEARQQLGGDRLVPGHHSRFGGLWTDRLDAERLLETRISEGSIAGERAAGLREFVASGYTVLRGAVDDAAVREMNAAVEGVFDSGDPAIHVECFEGGRLEVVPVEPRHRGMDVKVLDLYAHYEQARRVAFAAPIVAFLRELFEQDPMAFQSLYFFRGTEQPMHQDTAYVGVKSPLEFVGVWVALEDIRPGTGELEYYPGSHRWEDWVWDGRYKRMPPHHPEHPRYLAWLHEQARLHGVGREKFLGRRGDAIVWAADLSHGGSRRTHPTATRRSLVTHFCPRSVEPVYFLSGERHSAKLPHASGAWYCHLERAVAPPAAPGMRKLWRRTRRGKEHRP